MDNAKQPATGGELPLQGPHFSRRGSDNEPPPAFRPLKLVVQPSGLVLELTRPDMLAGRHSEADVRLPLPDVSRRHCRFVFTENAWHVFDLASLNGVFVNGERVQHALLHDHDLVTIGGFQLQVDLSGSATPPRDSECDKEIIHRIADAFPRIAADKELHRKAS
jgi:pSer/pThr/pTyr-binding forkhead associated (FHA) protein